MLSNEVERLENQNRKLRAAIEILQAKFQEDESVAKPMACEYCKFYLRHYVKLEGKFIRTGCGHCVHGRMKKRNPKDSCEYFELGDREADHLYKEAASGNGG